MVAAPRVAPEPAPRSAGLVRARVLKAHRTPQGGVPLSGNGTVPQVLSRLLPLPHSTRAAGKLLPGAQPQTRAPPTSRWLYRSSIPAHAPGAAGGRAGGHRPDRHLWPEG